MPPRKRPPPARNGGNPHRTPRPRPSKGNPHRRPKRRGKCPACSKLRMLRRKDRGLCQACYRQPFVRARFARLGGARGNRDSYDADFMGRAPLPEPTEAVPGTPEKVAVMEQRARDGQQLFHPDDAR